MPFVEIAGIEAEDEALAQIARGVTDAVVDTLSVPRDTVTIYFASFDRRRYAHGGSIAAAARRRIFVKLNILMRSLPVRRNAAAAVCAAIAGPINYDPRNIAIYFNERSADEVSHAGVLECDRPASTRTHVPESSPFPGPRESPNE
jgi:phenylpyruvate tautomerase PptA (4-oxalocrotonate tautomerase family)